MWSLCPYVLRYLMLSRHRLPQNAASVLAAQRVCLPRPSTLSTGMHHCRAAGAPLQLCLLDCTCRHTGQNTPAGEVPAGGRAQPPTRPRERSFRRPAGSPGQGRAPAEPPPDPPLLLRQPHPRHGSSGHAFQRPERPLTLWRGHPFRWAARVACSQHVQLGTPAHRCSAAYHPEGLAWLVRLPAADAGGWHSPCCKKVVVPPVTAWDEWPDHLGLDRFRFLLHEGMAVCLTIVMTWAFDCHPPHQKSTSM